MKKIYASAILMLASASCMAQTALRIDWDQIQHWTGSGANRAALVVQFLDDPAERSYVWGYRWDTPENELNEDGKPTVSGETMFRDIAASSLDLDLFTQYTGEMGNTVCGIGYSYRHSVMDYLEYDFEGASEDPSVAFNYYVVSGTQTAAPGGSTPNICAEAIEKARTTHILDHPLNARDYGYPAYDYDHWGNELLKYFDVEYCCWQAGWYDGYWAFLTGSENLRRLQYSGLGFSSVPLTDGSVHAWVFCPLQREEANVRRYAGGMPDTSNAKVTFEPDYEHFEIPAPVAVEAVQSESDSAPRYFSIDGRELDSAPDHGIYIVKRGSKTQKIILK